MNQIRELRRSGFTLIELMIVVAIIGVLAAVAIPTYQIFMKRSRAAEVPNILQGIRMGEEKFYATYARYTESIPWTWYACPPGGATRDSKTWPVVANDPWNKIGLPPDGPTYHTFQVVTSYDAAGNYTGPFPGGIPGSVSHAGQARPWFRAEACGDLDGTDGAAHYHVSNFNKSVVKADGGGTVDDGIY